jgi:hypothetical protein
MVVHVVLLNGGAETKKDSSVDDVFVPLALGHDGVTPACNSTGNGLQRCILNKLCADDTSGARASQSVELLISQITKVCFLPACGYLRNSANHQMTAMKEYRLRTSCGSIPAAAA